MNGVLSAFFPLYQIRVQLLLLEQVKDIPGTFCQIHAVITDISELTAAPQLTHGLISLLSLCQRVMGNRVS